MQYMRREGIILSFVVVLTLLTISACTGAEASEAVIEAAWSTSAHADSEARAFTRWDNNDPPEIPENCAKCHSTPGYQDFLGTDGSTPGQVDNPAPTSTTVECEACHNEVSVEKDGAIMPSKVELVELGRNSDCMECHQGRSSSVQVDELLVGLPPDNVNEDISGPGVHNSPVGPTLYGSEALGGYEYSEKSYSDRYGHVVDFDSCISCHDSHSLRVDPQRCSACHLGVRTKEDFHNIRASNVDYDGDRDTNEGMAGEIETLEKKLLQAIVHYTSNTSGVEPLVINGRFVNEAGESYSTWTPRLLRGAFNYQYSTKGPGSFVHNPGYIIQLLYDSIEDMGGSLSGMTRPELN